MSLAAQVAIVNIKLVAHLYMTRKYYTEDKGSLGGPNKV